MLVDIDVKDFVQYCFAQVPTWCLEISLSGFSIPHVTYFLESPYNVVRLPVLWVGTFCIASDAGEVFDAS